jgi:hypothetical protein
MRTYFTECAKRLLLLGVILLPISAQADPVRLYESAQPGPAGEQSGFGLAIFEGQFVGVRFRVPVDVTTTQIGGHFGGPGSIFGAVVQLNSKFDFPDSLDLSTRDVLGATVLDLSMPTAEFKADLAVPLKPGWYALVFGAGLFGATGSGAFAVNNLLDAPIPAFVQSGGITYPSPPRDYSGIRDMRVFVDGELTPAPEPGSLLLVGSGLVAWALRRRASPLSRR